MRTTPFPGRSPGRTSKLARSASCARIRPLGAPCQRLAPVPAQVPLLRPDPQYDWARGEALVSNFPPAPVSYALGWELQKGRSLDAPPKGVEDGQRLELDVKDHLTRRRKPVPDFDGYLGRFDPCGENTSPGPDLGLGVRDIDFTV